MCAGASINGRMCSWMLILLAAHLAMAEEPISEPRANKQQWVTSSFTVQKTPGDAAKTSDSVSAAVVDFIPPLSASDSLASPTIAVYFPSDSKAAQQQKHSDVSLFDMDAKMPDVAVPPASLFDYNIVPPAGVVQRIVVNNGNPNKSTPQLHPPPVTYSNDRQDVSLFDLEAGYVDDPSTAARPSVVRQRPGPNRRPSTTRLKSTAAGLSSDPFEPQPPADPEPPGDPYDLHPPADPEPPATPIALIQTNGGQYNQVSLTWAQLQGLLSPSTDVASIISSITTSGQSSGGSSIPQPPSPPIGPQPPAPPVGPSVIPVTVVPVGPGPTVGPPAPPRPPGGISSLPGLNLFGGGRPGGSGLVTSITGGVGSALGGALLPGVGNAIGSSVGTAIGSVLPFGAPASTDGSGYYTPSAATAAAAVAPSNSGGYYYAPVTAPVQQQQAAQGSSYGLPTQSNPPTDQSQPNAPAGSTIIIYSGSSTTNTGPVQQPPAQPQQFASGILNAPAISNPPVINFPAASPPSSYDSVLTVPSNPPSFSPPAQQQQQNYANFNPPSFSPPAQQQQPSYVNFNPPSFSPPAQQQQPSYVSFNPPSFSPPVQQQPQNFILPVLNPQPPAPPLPTLLPQPSSSSYGTQSIPPALSYSPAAPPQKQQPLLQNNAQFTYGQQDLPTYVIPSAAPVVLEQQQQPPVQLAVLSPPPVTYVVPQQTAQAQQVLVQQPPKQLLVQQAPVQQQVLVQQQPAFQAVASPIVLQPAVQAVASPVVLQPAPPTVFDPVYRPQFQQVFRVPFKSPPAQRNKGNAKAKGKEDKGILRRYKKPSNSYGAPPSYDYAPTTAPPADPPPADDPQLSPEAGLLQPQLDIQYQYRYSGPPIITRGEKAAKKLKKLFFKGAVLLGGLGAISAAPIVPGVINGGRRKRHDPEDERRTVPLVPLTDMLDQDSYGRPERKAASWPEQNETSLFDSLPYQGAPIPKELRQELVRYMPPADTFSDAECLQKSFCENLIELDDSPFQESFLFFYSALSPEADSNQWLQQSLTAARKKKCAEFYCVSETHNSLDEDYDAEKDAEDSAHHKPDASS